MNTATDNTMNIREDPDADIQGIHHIEIYVMNNCQAAHFYRTALGCEVIGTRGHEVGNGDRTSIAVQRRDIRLLLTAPFIASSPIAEHIRIHGEGVKDIAFSVRDVDRLFHNAIRLGAGALESPSTAEFEQGSVRSARISTCGELVHSLIEQTECGSSWCPGLIATKNHSSISVLDTALESIDHIAVAMNKGDLDKWIRFYTSALGFLETHQEQVATAYSAMRSKVVQTPNGAVRFPMMEATTGQRKSQIDNYIESHQGAGVQHLAFRSTNIVKSVSAMANWVEFLTTPSTYYDSLQARVGHLSELSALRRYGILADRDDTGLLLQVFTKPIVSRPTLFLEVIERRGAEGFGSGNIKALFEAVERAQAAQVDCEG